MFAFHNIQCAENDKVINSLANNKASGIDKLPARVIRDSAKASIPTLTTSFDLCNFASAWKMSSFKEKTLNNRPISSLPILSKVIVAGDETKPDKIKLMEPIAETVVNLNIV